MVNKRPTQQLSRVALMIYSFLCFWNPAPAAVVWSGTPLRARARPGSPRCQWRRRCPCYSRWCSSRTRGQPPGISEQCQAGICNIYGNNNAMWSAQTYGCSWRRRGWTGWQSAPRWSCLPAPRSCRPWRRGSPLAGRGMAAQMGVNNAFLLTRECCHLRVYWMVFDAVITLNREDNCMRLISWC